MGDVWPLIEAGLQDADASVRKGACAAISCLCEWLEPECVSKHTVLMPVGILLKLRSHWQLVLIDYFRSL